MKSMAPFFVRVDTMVFIGESNCRAVQYGSRIGWEATTVRPNQNWRGKRQPGCVWQVPEQSRPGDLSVSGFVCQQEQTEETRTKLKAKQDTWIVTGI